MESPGSPSLAPLRQKSEDDDEIDKVKNAKELPVFKEMHGSVGDTHFCSRVESHRSATKINRGVGILIVELSRTNKDLVASIGKLADLIRSVHVVDISKSTGNFIVDNVPLGGASSRIGFDGWTALQTITKTIGAINAELGVPGDCPASVAGQPKIPRLIKCGLIRLSDLEMVASVGEAG